MANEITVQATLTFQRDSIAMQASGSKTSNQAGTKGLLNQVAVGTSPIKLFDSTSPAPLATLGCIFVKNISTDTTNNSVVDVSYDSNVNTASAIISTLKPGEFCLLAANRSGSTATAPYQALASLYAKSNYAATPVLVGITEC